MDLYEALLSRRTVFKYAARPVDDAVLDRALEAARWAPNHKLTEPWGFVVVGPKTREALRPIADRIARAKAKDAAPEELPVIAEKAVRKLLDVPALVAVTVRRSPDDPAREREDYAAAVCALHNLVLSLWNDGIGAQWSTGAPTRDPETCRVLGIDAQTDDVIGFVKIGYPEVVPTTTRRPLAEVVRRLP